MYVAVSLHHSLLVGVAASLPHDFARILVLTNAEQSGVAEFVVFRPLDKTDLHDNLWLDPMRAQAITYFGSR